MQTLDEFEQIMGPLTRHWGDLSAAQWRDYYALLAHFEAPTLAAAVLTVMAEHVYPTFPKPAVIVQAAAALVALPTVSGEEAWALVMAEVKRGVGYPYYGEGAGTVVHPDFPRKQTTITDPAILTALEVVGGWHVLYQSSDDEDIAHRARFCKAYEAHVGRTQADARLLPAVRAERVRQLEAAGVIGDVVRQLSGRKEQP